MRYREAGRQAKTHLKRLIERQFKTVREIEKETRRITN